LAQVLVNTSNLKKFVFIHNKNGAPKIKLDKNVEKRILAKLKIKKVKFFLSISDDYPFALATVIIST